MNSAFSLIEKLTSDLTKLQTYIREKEKDTTAHDKLQTSVKEEIDRINKEIQDRVKSMHDFFTTEHNGLK